MAEYCFVLMPFGSKPDPAGGPRIDFDQTYREALKPAIEDAGLVPLRDDADQLGGIMQRRIFQQLILCEYAIAELTTPNPNVLYELGIRHALRPYTTMTVTARPDELPFDIAYLRSRRYQLDPRNRLTETEAGLLRAAVTDELGRIRREAADREPPADSPFFQLITEWQPPPLASLKTDRWSDEIAFERELKDTLADLRFRATLGADERARARAEASELARDPERFDAGILVELMLTHRALEDWDGMVAVAQAMPAYLRARVLVQEQLAFALNRRAARTGERDRQKALELLLEADKKQDGRSAETCGLLGRVHKDRWQDRLESDPEAAAAHLDEAIRVYSRGFLADPRDPYPGINAATLNDVRGDDASLRERDRLLPVLRYAVDRAHELEGASYWVHATRLELAVLDGDREEARTRLGQARASVREPWEPVTTASNLRMIAAGRRTRGEDAAWIDELAGALERPAAHRSLSVPDSG
jgi:MAP3K TRAFs-binding domain